MKNTIGLLLLLSLALECKEPRMSIASQQGMPNAAVASTIVNGQLNGRNTTWAWMQAPTGAPWQFQLQDYAVANGPVWNVAANTPIASLMNFDEVFVYIFNTGGQGVLARFGWSAENLSGAPGPGSDGIADDLGNDWVYPAQSASALVAGGQDGEGNATSILRFPTLPVEYGPILGSKVFRLQVKGPVLLVGLSTNGAPNAGQKVLVQIVPRSLGAPK